MHAAIRAYATETGDQYIHGEALELMGWAGSRKLTDVPYPLVAEFVARIRFGRTLSPQTVRSRLLLYRRLGLLTWACGRGKAIERATVFFKAAVEGEGGQAAYLRWLGEKRAADAARQRKSYRSRRAAEASAQEGLPKTTGQNASEEECQSIVGPPTQGLKPASQTCFKKTSQLYIVRNALKETQSGHQSTTSKNFHTKVSSMKKDSTTPPPTPQVLPSSPEKVTYNPPPTPLAAVELAPQLTRGVEELDQPTSIRDGQDSQADRVSDGGLGGGSYKNFLRLQKGKASPNPTTSLGEIERVRESLNRLVEMAKVASERRAANQEGAEPAIPIHALSLLEAVENFPADQAAAAKEALGKQAWALALKEAVSWENLHTWPQEEIEQLSKEVFVKMPAAAVPAKEQAPERQFGTTDGVRIALWDEMDSGRREDEVAASLGPKAWALITAEAPWSRWMRWMSGTMPGVEQRFLTGCQTVAYQFEALERVARKADEVEAAVRGGAKKKVFLASHEKDKALQEALGSYAYGLPESAVFDLLLSREELKEDVEAARKDLQEGRVRCPAKFGLYVMRILTRRSDRNKATLGGRQQD